jgi:hypothetical protein
MARGPDEADHGDVVVLRNLTDFTWGMRARSSITTPPLSSATSISLGKT